MDPQNNINTNQPVSPTSQAPVRDQNDTASFKKPTWVNNVSTTSHLGSDIVSTLKKAFSYTLWIVCFVISAISVYFVIYPGYYDYYTLKEEHITVNQEYEKVSAHLAYLNKLKALGTELQQNIAIAKNAIPVDEEIPYFLDQNIQMAKAAFLETQSITFGGLSVGSAEPIQDPVDGVPVIKMKSILVRLSLNGSYNNFIKFAELIENSRRLVSPKTMTVRILDDQTQIEEYLEKIKTGEITDSTEFGILSQKIDETENYDTKDFDSTNGLYTIEIYLNGYNLKDANTDNVRIEDIVNGNPNADKTLKILKEFKFYEESPVATQTIDSLFIDPKKLSDPFGVTSTPTPTPTIAKSSQ